MDKVKITNHQLFSLTANYTCGAAIIVISAGVTAIAKQDAWISALLTPIIGMLVIWLICFLGKQYPDMTFVEIIKQILGKWIGGVVACCFILYCLEIDAQMIWYIGNFINIHVMPQTPSSAINLLFVIVIVIAALYGIETIARASEIFMYAISILFISAIVLVLPNARIENLLPVFEKGITPTLKGILFLSSSLTFPSIVLMMIYPFNTINTSEARKSIFKGYLWGSLLLFISIIMSILVLGSSITASAKYPIYMLAKEIHIGVIFTRLEFIVAIVWHISLLTKAILYFYAVIIGISQLLELKDYKRFVLPLGLTTLVMSGVVFPDAIYQANWVNIVLTPFLATFGGVLPILLFIVFKMKKGLLKGY